VGHRPLPIDSWQVAHLSRWVSPNIAAVAHCLDGIIKIRSSGFPRARKSFGMG